MGQAKQRGTLEQRIAQANNKPIRHYTTVENAKAIIEAGWLNCESKKQSFDALGLTAQWWDGWNDSYNMTFGQVLERDWRAIGQWVWLCSKPPRCNADRNQVYFEFNSADIGAKKWFDYSRALVQTKDVEDAIYGVEYTAKLVDDIKDWWVAPSIDLSKCDYSLNTIKQKEVA